MTNPKNSDPSQLNPNGAARRRLLAILGGTAAGSLLSLEWAKPFVRVGALPAHAQGSPNLCAIFGTFGASVSAAGSVSASILASNAGGSTFLNSVAGDNVSVAGSYQPTVTGDHTLVWSLSHNVTNDVVADASVSGECCLASDSGFGTFDLESSASPGALSDYVIAVGVNDDGTCLTDGI